MDKILKVGVSMCVMILSVIFFTPNAFAWGSATHAYIDDKIGKNSPLKNLDEIYGAMAPDMFNFYPDVLVPGTAYYELYIQTHYNSLALWSEAQKPGMTPLGKAAAFGFVSHANGQLDANGNITDSYRGADYTAHGLYGNDPGSYVIDKANLLWYGGLKSMLEGYGIYLDNTLGVSVSHNAVEYAIDIMVAYESHDGVVGAGIGKKMMESALLRTPKFPMLMMKAYANDSETKKKIISAEGDFRKSIIILGQALSQKAEIDAINSVSELLAQLALEVYGIEGVSPALVYQVIVGAQNLCRDDYATAINQTISFVNTQMDVAEIQY